MGHYSLTIHYSLTNRSEQLGNILLVLRWPGAHEKGIRILIHVRVRVVHEKCNTHLMSTHCYVSPGVKELAAFLQLWQQIFQALFIHYLLTIRSLFAYHR